MTEQKQLYETTPICNMVWVKYMFRKAHVTQQTMWTNKYSLSWSLSFNKKLSTEFLIC